MKSYKVECLTDVPNKTGLTVRIRRGDEKVYDAISKKFQTQPTNPLIPLLSGTDLDSYLVSVVVDLNPVEFIDGDYNFYFHDETGKIFTGYKVAIFNGDAASQEVPSTTDIAVRILAASAGNGTVRDALIKANKP